MKAAVLINRLDGNAVLNILAGNDKALGQHIVPKGGAGDFLKPFVQIGFADAELFA